MSHIDSMRSFPRPAPAPSLSITPSIPQSTLIEVIILVVFQFIALVTILGRIYVRWTKGRRFFLNDYAIFWAFFWAVAITSSCLAVAFQGAQGFHIEEVMELAPERLVTSSKLFVVVQLGWAPANAGVKVSVIDLYIKIFGSNRTFRVSAYLLLGLILAHCLAVTLGIFLICTPLALHWDTNFKAGYCGNQGALFLATGLLNLIFDLCVIILPMPVLWGLKMPLRKKFGLAFMFSLGFIICGITIWRLVTIQYIDYADIFFNIAHLSTSSCLEPLLGIVNASLPILRPHAGLLVPSFSAFKLAIFSRMRGPASNNATMSNTHEETNRSTTRNFHRLYHHLYSLSGTDAQSPRANYTTDRIELEPRISPPTDNHDTVELKTTWELQSITTSH